MTTELSLGATYLGEGRCQFLVWAPLVQRVEVRLMGSQDRIFPLQPGARGYYHGIVEGVAPGSLYRYRLDGERERPDPVSRFQPQGVHGPSQVVDTHFPWDDGTWPGIFLQDYIIYELHVGLFSPEGTFEAMITYLDELKELGITAIELMPVAQFPGDRNWGYDGAYPFAVQNTYGGPEGLKILVNACHRKGLAVILDIVYNHLGPEGNYLGDFGPYFTDRYRTPWGSALNFDGPYSDNVRQLFIENALYWITEFHIDALRVDAVHAILDFSAQPFLLKLAYAVHRQADRLNRRIHIIAESALNDTRVIHPPEVGGYGLDAQWNDDFHHAVHTVLTGEQSGYYQDFGEFQHLIKAFREGFVYSGEYSRYRRRRHGNSSRDIPAQQFVVFAQNHDQVGNRMLGERLATLASFEGLKLAAGTVLLSPFIPLLFMGEEYGEESPFLYFTSHSDPDLIDAVRDGRKGEFHAFQWQGEPPDPQSLEAFSQCKLTWEKREQFTHKVLLDFYRKLIRLRRGIPALAYLSKETLEVSGMEEERLLFLHRWYNQSQVFCVMNFNTTDITAGIRLPRGRWKKILDSSEKKWGGPGSLMPKTWESGTTITTKPLSFALFEKENSR
ncbi:MAG TPA: malto-oligosyltrehalose trehalohydrolase [Desulfatiglandales bacterium]|nr:malto-oligosyltrehalose trehalohydrolase [Desulfatiglandales bacterium]